MQTDDKLQQREAILEAALSCFGEFGYERTTMEDIAARSGLPAAAVAALFPDKASIRAALLSSWSEILSAWITNA